MQGVLSMGEARRKRTLAEILKDSYAVIVYKDWPVWFGGLLIGIISIAAFSWSRPLGVVGGLREWADWSFYLMGVYGSHPSSSPHLSGSSILTFGLLWGALSSALLSRQFVLRISPPFELLRGAIGGTLMGIGAAMAMGCNIGGFFSAVSALSLSGIAMMAGLIAGAFLETRYLYWEMQFFRYRRGEGKPRRPRGGAAARKKLQSYAGAAAMLAALIAAFAYLSYGVGSGPGHNYARAGGLLICGLAFGMVLHRSRFAFLQAFREPFATGNAGQSRGMVVAVIVSVLGFAVLKGSGFRPEGVYVTPTFWAGSFIGGVIFGFGMPFAGGCASGSCWRSAEGNVKQVIALVFMGVSNSLSKIIIESSEPLASMMGRRVYLPQHVSYFWSITLIVAVMLLFYLVTAWNEKTRAFV